MADQAIHQASCKRALWFTFANACNALFPSGRRSSVAVAPLLTTTACESCQTDELCSGCLGNN